MGYIQINKNIIAQPQIDCFDQNNQLQWSYQTKHKVNHNEFYQFGQRLFYLNADNNLLTSILIDENEPQTQKIKKINFFILENFQKHDPYKNKSNHQLAFVETKISKFKMTLNNWFNKITYLFKNFAQIKKVNISLEISPDQTEFTISHQQNFYRNIFTDVKIEAEFTKKDQSEIIKVKGFYYDHNLWKVRAKLSQGEWNWQIKIKTPFWTNKQSGSIEIKQNQTKNLTIEDGSLIDEKGQLFVPIGLQDVIMDHNMDGNPLNQMGHAKNEAPPTNPKNSNYLNFPDYLDLYKNEAFINLFRYGPDNWAPSIWQNLDKPQDFAMNINGNLQGDNIISEAKQRDIRVMMSVFAFYPPYTSKEAIAKKRNQKVITQYLDYIIARYASSIDIWELANEALPSQEWQDFVSDYLAKNDPYHHPITISLENPQLKNSDLLSIHLYTHPKNNLELVEEIDKILQKTKEQNWSGATIFSELGFSDANYFAGSADLMRKITWIMAMQKIGSVWWNVGDIFWQNGNTSNIYLGPKERIHLKELSQKLQFFAQNTKAKHEIFPQKNLAVYQLENEQAELFYLVRLKHEQQIDKKFSIKTDKTSTVQIIDPQNSRIIQQSKINHQTSEILLPDFADDLVIFLFKATKFHQRHLK